MNEFLEARDIVHNPDFMLYRMDIDRAELHFLHVTKDTYLKSTHLDNRIQHTKERLVALSIDEVIRAFEHIQASQAPIQFIMHISCCSSTLLARALQVPGKTLVIREPWIFFQMSSVKTRMQETGEWEQKGLALVDLMCTLLNKTYAQNERVVVKPTNLANNIVDDVLSVLPAANGILLYTDLKDFLISNLKKSEDIKQKTPWLASEAAALVHYKEAFPDIIPAQLPHLRAAAVLWHTQMIHFQHLLNHWPERLRLLDSKTLLNDPANILPAVSNWLQLDINKQYFDTFIEGPEWDKNTNNSEHKSSKEYLEKDNHDIIDAYGQEIEETLTWTDSLLSIKPVTAPNHPRHKLEVI